MQLRTRFANLLTYRASRFAGAVARALGSYLMDRVSVKDFGAIGDGASHPLSSRYATLAAAQAVYAHATALTDEIDWCAAQAAVNAAITRANRTGRVYFPPGDYLFNRPLMIELVNGLTIEGAGASWSGSVGWDPYRCGTRIFTTSWTGDLATTALLRIKGTVGVTIRDLSLWGSIADPNARVGTLCRTEYLVGFGQTGTTFERVGFQTSLIGFQNAESNSNNCDGVTFSDCYFGGLTTGFKCVNDQGLNFHFKRCEWSVVTTCAHFDRGGGALFDLPVTMQCNVFVKATGGGGNVGTIVVNGYRADTSLNLRTQFLVVDNHGVSGVFQFNGCSNTSLATGTVGALAADVPLFVGKGASVIEINGGRYQLAKFAVVDGSGIWLGRLVARNVMFGSGGAAMSLGDGTWITGNALGRWKLTDCFGYDGATSLARMETTHASW